jgi:hypothetical protein
MRPSGTFQSETYHRDYFRRSIGILIMSSHMQNWKMLLATSFNYNKFTAYDYYTHILHTRFEAWTIPNYVRKDDFKAEHVFNLHCP